MDEAAQMELIANTARLAASAEHPDTPTMRRTCHDLATKVIALLAIPQAPGAAAV